MADLYAMWLEEQELINQKERLCIGLPVIWRAGRDRDPEIEEMQARAARLQQYPKPASKRYPNVASLRKEVQEMYDLMRMNRSKARWGRAQTVPSLAEMWQEERELWQDMANLGRGHRTYSGGSYHPTGKTISRVEALKKINEKRSADGQQPWTMGEFNRVVSGGTPTMGTRREAEGK